MQNCNPFTLGVVFQKDSWDLKTVKWEAVLSRPGLQKHGRAMLPGRLGGGKCLPVMDGARYREGGRLISVWVRQPRYGSQLS